MEDTCPDESIKLKLRLLGCHAVDVEVEVEIVADGFKIVVNLCYFLVFSKHINGVHFFLDHGVESIDQSFSQQESEFVVGEVSESLEQQPDVHIGNRVVDVKVIG